MKLFKSLNYYFEVMIKDFIVTRLKKFTSILVKAYILTFIIP